MFSVFLHFLRQQVYINVEVVLLSVPKCWLIQRIPEHGFLNQSRCPGLQLLQTSDPSHLPWVQNPRHACREIPVAPLMVGCESDHQRLQLTLKVYWATLTSAGHVSAIHSHSAGIIVGCWWYTWNLSTILCETISNQRAIDHSLLISPPEWQRQNCIRPTYGPLSTRKRQKDLVYFQYQFCYYWFIHGS